MVVGGGIGIGSAVRERPYLMVSLATKTIHNMYFLLIINSTVLHSLKELR